MEPRFGLTGDDLKGQLTAATDWELPIDLPDLTVLETSAAYLAVLKATSCFGQSLKV